MIENDTIKLLRECDSGAKMGIESISQVIDRVASTDLKKILNNSKNEHEMIEAKLQDKLIDYNDNGKDPGIMASFMSQVKTNFKLGIEDSDKTIADLMTEGCNMGIKSLNKYLNEFKAADEFSKDLTKKLISIEQSLVSEISAFL